MSLDPLDISILHIIFCNFSSWLKLKSHSSEKSESSVKGVIREMNA